MSSSTSGTTNANPAHIGKVWLVCCDVEYGPDSYGRLDARLVGPDVALSCPKCGRDMAVVEAP